MKSKLLALALSAVGSVVASTAMAAPLPSLPAGPIYIKFDNREQIAISGSSCTNAAWTCSTDGSGNFNEINWGVLLTTSITVGGIQGPNSIGNTNVDTGILAGGQVTGMFYGIEAAPPSITSQFPAINGYIDLWYRDTAVMSATNLLAATPAIRTAEDKATGFTEGVFLARIAFANGITTDPNVFINGTLQPTGPGGTFNAFAFSYGNIDLSAGGAWATNFDTDFFDPRPGDAAFGTRDFRFQNSYTELNSWDNCPVGPGPGNNCLIGAASADPATSVAIPEPGSLALVGLGMLGVAAIRRRNKKI